MFLDRLSNSKSDVIDQCLLKYDYRYIRKLPGYPSKNEDALDFGTYIHRIFELGHTENHISELEKIAENIKKDYPKFSEFVGFNDDGEIEEDKYTKKAKEMFEDIFSESKVENVLRKYFTLDESEKKKSISSEIRKNSENIVQEVKAKKIIEKYPSAKLLGKNKKNVLIFEINGSKLGVTKSGKVI